MIKNSLSKKTINTKHVLAFIFTFIMMFIYGTAHANSGLFDVQSTDVSLKILSALFGGLVEVQDMKFEGLLSYDPMLGPIRAFNAGVLILGGVLAAYTVLTGTLETAYDGKVLGKKYSSLYLPIRYSIGTALLLPIIGGGYSAIQAIMMWLVIQGVGLANSVWTGYIDTNLIKQNNISAKVMTQVEAIRIAESNFYSAMCVIANHKLKVENPGWLDRLFGTTYNYQVYSVSDGHFAYGNVNSFVNKRACGELIAPAALRNSTLTTTEQASTEKTDKKTDKDTGVSSVGNATQDMTKVQTHQGYLGDIGSVFAPVNVSPINKAHTDATKTMATKIFDIAQRSTAEKDSITEEKALAYYKEIEAAGLEYTKTIQSKIQGEYEKIFSNVIDKSRSSGFILAGAWFTNIIKTNELIFMTANQLPTAVSSFEQYSKKGVSKDLKPYFKAMYLIMDHSKSGLAKEMMMMTEEEKASSFSASAGNPVSKLMGSLSNIFTTIDLYELKYDSRHPIVVLNDLGNRLESIIIMAILSLGIAIAGIAAVPIPGISNIVIAALKSVSWFIAGPIFIFVTGAVALKYFLPNLPYLIWVGAMIGWILLVIEAFIAVLIWVIMHLHPNGDDFTGRGGNGYTLVLTVLLQPTFMTFGLIAALNISAIIGEFINKTFFEVFISSSGSISNYQSDGISGSWSSFTGLPAMFSMIAGTVLYAMVMYTLIRKCFGLIHELPSQLLRWIGGADNTLSAFAGEFGSATDKGQQMTAAGLGYTAQHTSKAVTKQTGNMIKGIESARTSSQKSEGSDGSWESTKLSKDGERIPFMERVGKMLGTNVMKSQSNMAKKDGFLNKVLNKDGVQMSENDGKYRTLIGQQALEREQSQARAEEVKSILGNEGKSFMDRITGRSQRPAGSVSPYNISKENLAAEDKIHTKEAAIAEAISNINRISGGKERGKNAGQIFLQNLSENQNVYSEDTSTSVQAIKETADQHMKDALFNRIAVEGYSKEVGESILKLNNDKIGDGKKIDTMIDSLNSKRDVIAVAELAENRAGTMDEAKVKASSYINDAVKEDPEKIEKIREFIV